MLDIKTITVNDITHKYQVYGSGKIDLVIEMGLGATAGEWQHIAEKLSAEHTVLLYERCRSCTPERRPENIAHELHALLEELGHAEKIILLAHSQGGLYAQQFARLYPEMVSALVLLDPLSANDSHYKDVLDPEEQKKSGFDKTANLVTMHKLAKLHLGFMIKAVMKTAPPFYYYKGFSKDATDYILNSITVPEIYTSALDEYKFAHADECTAPLKTKAGFPDIPLILITHTPEFSINEIMEFGRTDRAFAEKVDALWQSLMAEYLSFSDRSQHYQAQNSGHYIHLSEPELIEKALQEIKAQLQ